MHQQDSPAEECDNGSDTSIDLNKLKSEYRPGITSNFGGALAEQAAVCLDSQGHASGIELQVEGDASSRHPLIWRKTSARIRRCHADEQVATEHGAYGIAILIVDLKANLTVVERSRKGTGFDYWLGTKKDKGPYFQRKARLEVSGIRSGDVGRILERVRSKKIQTAASASMMLPAYVVVVEFGTPTAQLVTTC